MKKRSKIDIYADILTQAKDGVTQTRIMYKANLSFFLVKKCLNELTSLGLIETQEVFYKTTTTGLRFLVLYDEIESLASLEKKQLTLRRHA